MFFWSFYQKNYRRRLSRHLHWWIFTSWSQPNVEKTVKGSKFVLEMLTTLKPDSNKLLLPLCWWSLPFSRNREWHVPIAINYWILEHFKIFFASAVTINIVKQQICLSAMNITKRMCWLKCKHYWYVVHSFFK